MNRTPVVLNLLIINGLVYLVQLLLMEARPDILIKYFFLYKVWQPFRWPEGGFEVGFHPVQLVSHFFSHSPFSFMHILFNMLALYMIGQPVELVMGSKRFLQFYLFSGLVGGVIIALLDPSPSPVIGASGAVSGVFLAFALIYPHHTVLLFFIIPIQAIRLLLVYVLLSSVFFISEQYDPGGAEGGISHFGHLAGMGAGLLYFYLQRLRAEHRHRR